MILDFKLRALHSSDRDRVAQLIATHWGSEIVVAHGMVYQPAELPGFVAYRENEWLGLLTYWIEGKMCEIVTPNSFYPEMGIGTALIHAVTQAAEKAHCERLWLITTNDNLDALRFYQKRGFRMVAIHSGAVNQSRQIKPEIPPIGEYGIPLCDEIELEISLIATQGKVNSEIWE